MEVMDFASHLVEDKSRHSQNGECLFLSVRLFISIFLWIAAIALHLVKREEEQNREGIKVACTLPVLYDRIISCFQMTN